MPGDDVAGSDTDYLMVCDGLDRAKRFFSRHGITMQYPVKVGLHDTDLQNYPGHVGVYDAAEQRVDILTLARARRMCEKLSPFGLPMDESLYTSFAVHEFSHAIAAQNFTYSPPSFMAQEYLAYVVQLVTMDKLLRDAVLRQYSVDAFDSVDDISLVYYELNPGAFGVKAYKHYKALDDPTGFVHQLLSGAVRPAGPYSDW